MEMKFKPQGVCANQIVIDVDNGIVNNIKFVGGCSGNTQGVAALVKGMKVTEVIERLQGIRCGFKKTSCPDQLAKALSQIVE